MKTPETVRHRGRGVALGEALLNSASQRAGRHQLRRVAVAVCTGLALSVAAVVIIADPGRDRVDIEAAGLVDGSVLDIGSVDRLPPGDDTVLEAPGVFVLRATDGEITAFSRRAPKQGCRLVLAGDLENLTFSDRVLFHDPCHGANFDRDGRKIGGPGLRGMYRYDVTPDDGRIRVDTSLARPLQRERRGG